MPDSSQLVDLQESFWQLRAWHRFWGTVHAFSRIGQEPAKILAIFSPAGFEKFFDEAVDLDVTDTEAYVAKAKALAEKYNMEIVGPPLEL